MNLDQHHHARHDQKKDREAAILLHAAAARDHAPSPERRSSSNVQNTKCCHQSCYEREQQSARELQKLRDSFGALKLEKDKEIAFLRDQLAACASMSKSPVRFTGTTGAALASCSSVGVQTASPPAAPSAMTTSSAPPVHAIASSIFSVTDSRGVVRTVRLDRQASLKSARVLAAMPRDQAKGVADRVAAAFADPVLALPYLHSIQFGADLVELSAQVCSLLESEARCLSVQSPVYVLGDIHGNYTDLRFFADTMWPMGMGLTPGSFLFLGDYVDRGQSSLECIAYLFAQKLLHPKKLFLLRGNHETRAINGLEAHYGSGCFLSQCKARFGNEEGYIVWHQINHAFDRLPLAAVIDNDIFCVHGGVPRPIGSEKQLESIQKIPSTALLDVLDARYYEDDAQISMVSDMLWGDPVSEENEPSMDSRGFGKSLRGGVAVSFGDKAIEHFLQQHRFSRILRAHEAKVDGVAVSKSARVITIFSTSKDHGLGEDAKCGCLLIDHGTIIAINRLPQSTKSLQLQRRRSMSFQRDAQATGTRAMGATPRGREHESDSAGIARSTDVETSACARRSGSVASDAVSRSQHDEEDNGVGHAARATVQGSMDAGDENGSESTDDEDDQSLPPPPPRRPRMLSSRPSSSCAVDRARSNDACAQAAGVASSAAALAPIPAAAAPPAQARERVDDNDDDGEEDNNQNDDI